MRRFAALLSLILLVTGCLMSARPRASYGPELSDPLAEPQLQLALMATPHASIAQPPATIEQLRERIAAVLSRERVPGVGLALVERDGVIWAGGVGVADLASQRPVTADTVFRVASISKSFVALAVMRLVERGRLSLTQPLHELMPDIEIDNRWADNAPITLAHALEHTAGFDDMRFNEWYGRERMPPREALAINPRSRDARWQPGSRISYSNPGYTIAGHAIELATGEAWDTFVERELLRPLGMDSAAFHRTPQLRERLATGYDGPGVVSSFDPIAHAPAGALLSSPRELAQLVLFWLRRGQLGARPIVGPQSLARIEQTATLAYPNTDTNYGLGNYGDVRHGVRGRGHDGGLPGFLSVYRYYPELGVGYVVLLNSTHSARAYLEIRALMFAYLTRGHTLPEPPTAPRDDEAIAAATGFYGLANPRIALFGFIERATSGIELRPSADGVELELLHGGRIEMVSTGDGGFRHRSEGGTSVRVATNADGRGILHTGMGYFERGSGLWARLRLRALVGALLLIQLGLVWGAGWLLVAGLRKARGGALADGELRLHLEPAAAAGSFMLMLFVAQTMFARGAFHDANAWSIGLCATTLVFPAASASALVTVVRAWARRIGPAWARLLPSLIAVACFGMTLYLLVNGIIGLRIWAY